MTISPSPSDFAVQPRAIGVARLTVKKGPRQTVIGDLFQKGASKLLFPRPSGPDLTAVLLNTAGGVTGGDRFDVSAVATRGTALTVTTQAAERAYRAMPGETGHISTRLTLEDDSRLSWLPQETLIYDGAALSRSLRIDMAGDAQCLMVEPLILGRTEMGEEVRNLRFRERIDIWKDGKRLFADRSALVGDPLDQMAGRATGNGAKALANLVFAAPNAHDLIDAARAVLGPDGGVSAPTEGLIFARLLASDGYALRKTLLPLISVFRQDPLPRTWML